MSAPAWPSGYNLPSFSKKLEEAEQRSADAGLKSLGRWDLCAKVLFACPCFGGH